MNSRFEPQSTGCEFGVLSTTLWYLVLKPGILIGTYMNEGVEILFMLSTINTTNVYLEIKGYITQ